MDCHGGRVADGARFLTHGNFTVNPEANDVSGSWNIAATIVSKVNDDTFDVFTDGFFREVSD